MDEVLNNCDNKILSSLEKRLNEASTNHDIEELFIHHCKESAVCGMISAELLKISQDVAYSATGISNKLTWGVFDNDKFNYSVELHMPGMAFLSPFPWTGGGQIFSVKGGDVEIMTLQVPVELNINDFKPGVLLDMLWKKIIKAGGFISNWDGHKIIKIIDVTSPIIIEKLTIKNSLAELQWKFDNTFTSFSVTSSRLLLTRLMTILNLAIEMETDVPQRIYDTIFELGDSHIKFRAIEAMLLEGHDSAFEHLQLAMKYSNKIISMRAAALYNQLSTVS